MKKKINNVSLKKALCESVKLTDSNGYYDSYKDNIFKNSMSIEHQKMFCEGSGGELHSKAEAIHSSSMLSYNFFHWICEDTPFVFRGVCYTKVLFEVKMRTLKTRSNPANMDVVLIGEKDGHAHILFIESKFLEYASKGNLELSASYYKKENWYDPSVDWNEIINYKAIEKGYNEGIKQTITHLFGIHHEIVVDPSRRNKHFKNIDLKNCVIEFTNFIFNPKKEFDEHESYESYKKLYEDFLKGLEDKKLKVIPTWCTYSEIWKVMNGQITPELYTYLENKYVKYMDDSQ